MNKFVFSFAVVALLSSCGGSTDASTFGSAREMASAMTSGGLSCSGLERVAKADRDWGTEDAIDVANCTADGEGVQLLIFKDSGQQDNFNGMAKSLGCGAGKAFGISTIDYVEGNNWDVTNVTMTVAKKIVDAIGGKAIHIKC